MLSTFKISVMKLYQLLVSQNTGGNVLYLILIATSIDYLGILDYTLKAIIGSITWFGLKLIGDYFSAKVRKNTNHSKRKTEQP